MTMPGCRLLCIDLQIDASGVAPPEARAIFGGRQLLAMARDLRWDVVHGRRRSAASGAADISDERLAGLRPLMSERVFLRSGRPVTESAGLTALLDSWSRETVYVAAFDSIALLSCLLACYERGPRLVLVEDTLSATSIASGRSPNDVLRAAAHHLAADSTTLSDIIRATATTVTRLPRTISRVRHDDTAHNLRA
jgi:hypothetical protein